MADLTQEQASTYVSLVDEESSRRANVVENGEGGSSLSVKVFDPINTFVDGSGLNISTSGSFSMGAGTSQTLVSVTGKGYLGGLKVVFSHSNGGVRVTVDSSLSFELRAQDLRDFNFEEYTNTGLGRWFGGQQYGEFEFFPPQFIGYNTSLLVETYNSGGFTITRNRAMVIYS